MTLRRDEVIVTLSAQRAIDRLPSHFTRYSTRPDFLLLTAILDQLYGFKVEQSIEAVECIDPQNDILKHYSSSPSISFSTKDISELMTKYHEAREKMTQPDDKDFFDITNRIIRTQLQEQQHMLSLIEEFYAAGDVHTPSHLIVESSRLGGGRLRPQNSTSQVLLDAEEQKRLSKRNHEEMVVFGVFLMNKYETDHSTPS